MAGSCSENVSAQAEYLNFAGEPSTDRHPQEADVTAYINKRMRDFVKLQGLI